MSGRRRMRRHSYPRGMALVLVLWIVAALAIFVTSLGRVVRQEAAVVSVTRNIAQGRAVGEAAIYQLVQQMAVKPTQFNERTVEQVPWGNQIIEVEVMPWSGLVDINAASPSLLTTLFTRLGLGSAESLAQAMVEARQAARSTSGGFAWETAEDLLQLPGFTYGMYAQIRPFVVADTDGRAGVNFKAASPALVQLLDSGGAGAQDAISSTRFRLTARVVFDGQGAVMVTRDVDIGGGGQGSLPWTVLSAAQIWVGRI